jgi:hypothetical protein
MDHDHIAASARVEIHPVLAIELAEIFDLYAQQLH